METRLFSDYMLLS